MKEYRTVSKCGTAYYEIQKSKFYTYTAHVETEEAAREFVQSIKKKHFDARHNCSAWILGTDCSLQKSNDDGEPGGTAGNPILEAIKQQRLTNTVVVVTRYFGGIKLGAGGLIRAYNHSATIGLDATPKIELKLYRQISATIDYSLLGVIENWIRNNNILTREAEYTDKVTVKILAEINEVNSIMSALTDMTSAQFQAALSEPEYIEVPIS